MLRQLWRSRNRIRRWTAILLCLCMTMTMFPQVGLAEMTEESGYTAEGSKVLSETEGKASPSDAIEDETEDYEDIKDGADIDLASDSNADKATSSNADKRVKILSWEFVDPEGRVLNGEFAMPGVNAENQADFDTVVSMLPKEITAVTETDGAEETITVAITGWNSEYYVTDPEGNWPIGGRYVFVAELEEGYACEPMPSVAVMVGGGNLRGTDVPFIYINGIPIAKSGQPQTFGGGTAKYTEIADNQPGILTLSNVTIDSGDTLVKGIAGGIVILNDGQYPLNIEIVYEGKNVIRNVASDTATVSCGIYAAKTPTIRAASSDATLEISSKSGAKTSTSAGITGSATFSPIMFDGGTVTVTSGDTFDIISNGIIGMVYLQNNCKLTVTSGSNSGTKNTNGIQGSIIVDGSIAEVSAGAASGAASFGIYGGITIKNGGTLTVTGGKTTGTNNSYGIGTAKVTIGEGGGTLVASGDSESAGFGLRGTSKEILTIDSPNASVTLKGGTQAIQDGATVAIGANAGANYTAKVGADENSLTRGDMSNTGWYANKYARIDELAPPETTFAVDADYVYLDGNSVQLIGGTAGTFGQYTKFKLGDKYIKLRADISGNMPKFLENSGITSYALEANVKNTGRIVAAGNQQEATYAGKTTITTGTARVKGICTGNSRGNFNGDVEVITKDGSNPGNIYLGSMGSTGDTGTHTLTIESGVITSIEDNESPGLKKNIIIKGGAIGTWNETEKGLDLDFANPNGNLTVTVEGKLAETSSATFKTVKIHLPADPGTAWGTSVTLAVCDDAAAAAFNANRFRFDDETAATEKGWTIVADGNAIKAVNKTKAKYLWYTKDKTANEFHITNADELYAFAKIVNGTAKDECPDATTSNFKNKSIYLDQNIDLKGLDSDTNAANGNWTPIGSNAEKPFEGTFESSGSKPYKISNLSVITTDSTSNIGLFGNCATGGISNLALENVTLTGRENAGGIAGLSKSTISGCTVTGTITGARQAGGITGTNDTNGLITNCINQAVVSGIIYAGGIAGKTGESTNITYCVNEAAISGKMAGGIAGGVSASSGKNGNINNCYQTGSVTAESYAGGIAGELGNSGIVTQCYTTGTVETTGDDSSAAGGIVGYVSSSSTVTNCVALNTDIAGNVNGTNGRIIGKIYTGTKDDNYARSDMMINGAQKTSSDKASKDGLDLFVGKTDQSWTTWFGSSTGWRFMTGKLSAGALLPTINALTVTNKPTLPQQTVALLPAFAEKDNTYKMPTATDKVAKLTLTNGPADSYQIYSAETGGTELANPIASVAADTTDPMKSLLHLTHASAPTATISYWVSAKMTGGAESARTKITIQQAIGTESKVLAYRTNLTDSRVFEGKVEESTAKLILDNLDHSFRDETATANITKLPIMVRVSDGASVTAQSGNAEIALTKKDVTEGGKVIPYWTGTYSFDTGKTIRLTVTSEDKLSTKQYTMGADIKTYGITYELETGITKQAGPTDTIDLKEDFTAVFRAEAGSSITKSGVTVTVAGVALADADYTVTADADDSEISTLAITSTGKAKITGAVKVKVEQYSSVAELTKFAIANSVKQTVSTDGKTIDVQMPAGTNLAALAPTFTLSGGATAAPVSGAAVDFSNSHITPVTYVVTAEDGVAKNTYKVTARIPSYGITYTLKNFVDGSDSKKTAALNETLSVSLTAKEGFTVPKGTDTKNLIVTMQDVDGNDQTLTAGTGYTYTPGTDSKTATLTIAKVTGKVTTTVTALHIVKEITEFTITNQVGKTVIDQNKLTIQVNMPHGTDLTKLSPTITLKPDSADAGSATSAKVVPVSGTVQNFAASGTTPVKYTVTAENGTTAVYNVTVQIPSYKLDSKLTNMTVTALEKKEVNLHEPLDLTIIAATGYSMPKVTDTTNLIVTMKGSDGTVKTLTPGTDYTYDITVTSPSTVSLKVAKGKVTGDVFVTLKALNQAKAITKFEVTGQVGTTVLDEAKHTIQISMPHGTDLKKIKPIIEISADSTVSPASNVLKDFSDSVKNPLTYTVTAENGDKQEYQVTVKIPSYKLDSKLTNMTVTALDKKDVNLHEPLDLTIIAASGYTMPAVTDTTNLIVTMKDSDGTAKTLTPGTDYTYNITDTSSSTASLKVAKGKVTGDVFVTLKALNEAKAITDFTVDKQVGDTDLDEKTHTIRTSMPHGTDLKKIKPSIKISANSTVSPENSELVDFSDSVKNPLTYTVTAENGTTQAYQVTVQIPEYKLDSKLTNMTVTALDKTKVNLHEPLDLTIIAASGYSMPAVTDTTNLSVTMKGSDGTAKTLTPGTDYTYNITVASPSTASIKIAEGNVTGDVFVTLKALNQAKAITKFQVTGQVGDTVLNEAKHTIQISMPHGTDLKKIKPIIEISVDSTVSPASNVLKDFSDSVKNPLTYTVTAENGDEQEYQVIVQIPSYPVTYGVDNIKVDADRKLDAELHEKLTVKLEANAGYSVPEVTDAANLKVTMKDYDGTLKTLTAGTDYTYTPVASPANATIEITQVTGDVDITLKALSQAKKITAFTITNQIGKTKLDEEKRTIDIMMPYGTDLTSLSPSIKSDQYTTVKPANGVSTDFGKSETTPVKYTVTAQDGSTADYQVKVWIPEYSILYDLTDTTAVGQPDIIAPNQAVSITVTSVDGYGVSKSVTIKVKDGDATKTLTEGKDYTYTPAANKNTAVIVLPKTYLCTGDLTITVDGLSRKKQITEFTIDKQVGTTELKEDEGTIQVVVPYGTQLKTIAPVVVATDSNATVNPASKDVTDFSDSRKNPVVYTVTAEDGSEKEYKVVVTYPKATVTFDSNKGTAIAKQEIIAGELAVKPKEPTREPEGETYYRFDGWYADPALTTIYDFTQKVPGDITLYAKWTAGYQVLVDAVNGQVQLNGMPGAVIFYPGQTVTVKAIPNSGYRFSDWSTSVDVALLADANAKETTFTMPERTVKLTATFRQSSSGGSSGGGSTAGTGTGGVDTNAPGYGGSVVTTTPGSQQAVEGGIKESTDIVSKDKGGHESKVTVDVTKDPAGNVISSGAAVTPAQKPAAVANGNATIAAGIDAAALNQAASIAGANAERPLPLTVTLPSASAIEQLHNPQAQSLSIDITIPKSVSGAANLRIDNLRLEKAVIEAAKAEAKDIKISMKDETGALIAEWAFGGQDLRNSTAAMTDVNLYMVLTPAKALTSANETLKNTILGISENGLVITFRHSGQLPSTARIKVASGIKTGTGITAGIKPGDVVDLYYHNRQKNTLETVAGGPFTVDAGGYVTIAISHCSDYVLIPRKDARQPAVLQAQPQASKPAGGVHTIVGGDTLWKIAKRYGCTTEQLTAANPGLNASDLTIGQEIKLP